MDGAGLLTWLGLDWLVFPLGLETQAESDLGTVRETTMELYCVEQGQRNQQTLLTQT